MDRDFGFTERTLLFRLFPDFLFFVQMLQFIDLAYQQEDDEADYKEVYELCQERAVVDGCGVFAAAENDQHIIEIDSAGKDTEQRHEYVIHQRADDAGKSASDDHTDSQIDHISF